MHGPWPAFPITNSPALLLHILFLKALGGFFQAFQLLFEPGVAPLSQGHLQKKIHHRQSLVLIA